MGRRSSKSGQGTGAVPEYDTVGMTILPGHPLPEWAAPEYEQPFAVLAADDQSFAAETEGAREMAEPFDAGAAPAAAGAAEAQGLGAAEHDASRALVGAGVGSAAATQSANVGADPAGLGAGFPGAGYAGAGYAGAGYGPAAGTVGAPAPTGAGHPAAGYGPMGHATGYGAAPGYPPAAGYAAAMAAAGVSAPPAPAAPFAPPAPRAPEPPVGGGAPAPSPTQQAMAPSHPSSTLPTGSMGQVPDPSWPADPGHGTATATLDAPSAANAPAPSEARATSAVPADHQAPATPSQGWTSPDRPELSPEHVALLTWWAEMIAKGQFPAPPGAPAGPPAPPARESRRRRGRKHATAGGTAQVTGTAPTAAGPPPTVATGPATSGATKAARGSGRRTALVLLGLGGIAAIGLAVAFGPGVVSALTEDPAPVPPSNLTMPTAVGDLVAISSPDVSEQLQSMLGLGLRPAGVTTTAGYGADPASPVVLAGLATTTPADGDAAQQITTWAARMGATVGEPVAGGSGAGGVTCAPVTAIPDALPGSFCVWTGSDRRGQSYVVGASTEAALQQTAQLREGVVATG